MNSVKVKLKEYLNAVYYYLLNNFNHVLAGGTQT